MRTDATPLSLYLATLYSPHSIQSCKSRLNAYTRKFGHECGTFDWSKITYASVVEHLSQIIISGKSFSTANQSLAFIKGVSKQAWFIGLLPSEEYHRIQSIRKYKGHRLPTGQALYKGQVLELFLACEKDTNKVRGLRDAVILSLGFHLALRRSEIAKVKIEDVDLNQLTIRIIGKGNKEAELPISTNCAMHIKRWIEVREEMIEKYGIKDQGFLLGKIYQESGRLDTSGLRGEAVAQILKKIVKRSKLSLSKPLRPHDMRRTRITEWITHGSARIAQKLARHADIQTTLIYDRSDAWPEMCALQQLCD